MTLRKAATLGFALWSASSLAGMTQEMDGKVLYMEFCASCHGANLEGQPDWRQRLPNGRLPAPPHDATGHTRHHSDEQLFRIVKDGLAALAPGYETDMPAFSTMPRSRRSLTTSRAPGRSANGTSSKADDHATQCPVCRTTRFN